MNLNRLRNKYCLSVLVAATAAIGCTSCAAMSRLGQAEVSISKGLPCFSIPLDAETKHGLPLHSLSVSEKDRPDWRTQAAELWQFTISDPAPAVTLRPQDCIRYGDAPANAQQRVRKPLEQYHVYYVHVAAEVPAGDMFGYAAWFCIKPDATGNMSVQVVPRDKDSGRRRYEVCTRPPG